MLNREALGSCPICGETTFEPGFKGRMARGNAAPQCSGCGSLERHRIIFLLYQSLAELSKDWDCLQFAPEGMLNKAWFKSYEYSAFGGHNSLDMTDIDLPDASYDFIISNHVIEHVSDDKKALRECLRVVGPEGLVHVTAPTPTYRVKTTDWGFANPDINEHYRDYGTDMGLVLCSADPSVFCISITGLDPVTFEPDVIFLFSHSEKTLEDVTAVLLRKSYAVVRVK